ncbi:GNAT family N-acetyltransferase [Nocardioides sp.]|uniref:GNAT family N-acetyltransferase n=1 Tax=Nocardioides sp. TaxID=35761 RepID=UPI00378326C6
MEHVRRAVVADAAAIAAVHRESRAAYYGDAPDASDGREAMWEHLLGLPDVVAHVVEDDHVVVAFLSARRRRSPEAALEMLALYVLPDRFGRGLGTRLHRVFVSELRADEVGVLEVWEGNHRAIQFYRRHGWTATTTSRPGPYDKPFITYRLA